MMTKSQLSEQRAVVRTCKYCGKPAVAYIRYARLYLCSDHFQEYVEKKVERVLKRVGVLRQGVKILAALSGGKDSAAMLRAMVRVAKPKGVIITGLHIDLGYGAYSLKSKEAVLQACEDLGLECIVVNVEEVLGLNVYELARKVRRPVCSVCGIIKRYIINAAAIELKADYIAMGHNADDIIAYTLKEFLAQNLPAISKLGPSTQSLKGLAVGRLRPLYEVTEKEALLYTLLTQTPFLHDECPYRPENPIEHRVKEFMNKIEEEHPGLKMMFIRNLEKNIEFYKEKSRNNHIGRCKHCGLISAGDECSFCRLTKRALGEPLGPRIKEYLASRRRKPPSNSRKTVNNLPI